MPMYVRVCKGQQWVIIYYQQIYLFFSDYDRLSKNATGVNLLLLLLLLLYLREIIIEVREKAKERIIKQANNSR